MLSTFDQTIVFISDKESLSGLYALKKFSPNLVLLASHKKTKKEYLRQIKAIADIGILFYD